MNGTDKTRWMMRVIVGIGFGVAYAGYLLDKDPAQLLGILTMAVAGLGIGEGANIGKRVTFKKEATE
jgi:hypothetical protein